NLEELIYELDDLEELVALHFQDDEENNHTDFSAIIELNHEFIEKTLSNEMDQNKISKDSFHHIIDILLISIEAES
ncbi:364_t:CDS:1, partial [Ambispora leptoticha]